MKKALMVACVLALGGSSVVFGQGKPETGPVGEWAKRADSNGDRKLSADEVKAAEAQLFVALDKNNDGNLSKKELAAFAKDLDRKLETVRTNVWGELFASKDKNGDRRLTRDEVGGMPDAMFTGADTNKDGGLDKQELKAWLKTRAKPAAKGDRKGPPADANDDGVLDKAEASAALRRRFERRDANHDGSLDRNDASPRADGKATTRTPTP